MSTNQKGPIAIRLTAVLLLAVVMLVPRSIFAAASLTISSPAAGSTVSGSVTVSVTSTLSASDDWWNSLAVDGVDTGLNDSGRRERTSRMHRANTSAINQTSVGAGIDRRLLTTEKIVTIIGISIGVVTICYFWYKIAAALANTF